MIIIWTCKIKHTVRLLGWDGSSCVCSFLGTIMTHLFLFCFFSGISPTIARQATWVSLLKMENGNSFSLSQSTSYCLLLRLFGTLLRYHILSHHPEEALYYVFNLILPCMFITAVTLLVLYLPAESGEKVMMRFKCVNITVVNYGTPRGRFWITCSGKLFEIYLNQDLSDYGTISIHINYLPSDDKVFDKTKVCLPVKSLFFSSLCHSTYTIDWSV